MSARLHEVIAPTQPGPIQSHPVLEVGRSARSTVRYRFLPAALAVRLERASLVAGTQTSTTKLLLVAVLAVAVVVIIGHQMSLGAPIVLIVAAGAAILVPYFFVKYLKGRYDAQFLQVFPDALDLIVRAIKAGLPVSDALVTVGAEIADPVGKEFRQICDEIKIAVDLDHSLARAADRIQIIDFRFFVSALALQRRIGGNLAETLGNLSNTIRRRTEMRLKARALSAEGRVSAIVLSILPIALATLLYLVNPEFGSMLLHDPRGHKMIGVAAVILIMGIVTMRWMIKRAVR
jgi:Flp pilus assembly protein TadB